MSHYVTTLRDLRLTIVFCSNFISVDFSYTLISIPSWIITCKRMWCNVKDKTDISDRYVFLSTWTTPTSLNVAFLWTWRHRCHFAQNRFNQFSANRLSVLNYTSVNRAHVYPKPIPEPLRLYICITGFLLFFSLWICYWIILIDFQNTFHLNPILFQFHFVPIQPSKMSN